jgi:hypothetical protein
MPPFSRQKQNLKCISLLQDADFVLVSFNMRRTGGKGEATRKTQTEAEGICGS